MARPLRKSPLVLLAVGLWILASSASLAKDDNLKALNQRIYKLFAKGEYQEAIPLAEKAVEIARRLRGPEHPDTALTLNNHVDIFSLYSLFPYLKGTEVDLAVAVLRYKGVVLDSIVEDRLLAESSQGSENQKRVEQLKLDKRQLGQLLLQPAQKLSAETNQRIETLEGEVEKIESQLAQHVAGLGQARHALRVNLGQVQATIPDDGALIEYMRYVHYLGKNQSELRYGAIVFNPDDIR